MLDIVLRSILQASLCFVSIAALRVAIVYLGTKIGAILMGVPMITLPMLVVQAAYGPAITQRQTVGSIASNLALTCALWALRLPVLWTPFSAVLTVLGTWLVAIIIIYVADLPVELMTAIVIANGFLIVILYRNYQPTVLQTRSTLADGAVPVAIFLVLFFLMVRFIPEFLRGVFVTTPIVILATLYFVRRLLVEKDFEKFTIYTQGSTGVGATFVIILHFTLLHLPIALSLATALAASLMALMVVARIWRGPKASR